MTMPRRRTFYRIGCSISDAGLVIQRVCAVWYSARGAHCLDLTHRLINQHGHVTAANTMTSRVWYRAVLCEALVSACQIPVIREHFADALGAAGWPEGACLFLSTRHTRRRRLREDDNAAAEAVFFSPAAIAAVPHLIAVCGAEPSPPPDRASATLLVGE